MDILVTANEYFDGHFAPEAWFEANDTKKSAVLAHAQLQLEPYKGRTSEARFYYAIFEQALWLLQSGTNSRAELQREGVTSFSLGGLSEQYNTKGRPTSIAPAAWSFLEKHGVKVGRLK